MKIRIHFLLLISGWCSMTVAAQEPPISDLILFEKNVWPQKITLGTTAQGRPVEAFYFEKKSRNRALIFGGMHGSEFYGSEVANQFIDRLRELQTDSFPWAVLIIPELFPDNVAAARQHMARAVQQKRTPVYNYGRLSCPTCTDPNRQLPPAGQLMTRPLSETGHPIEPEMQWLLSLTTQFNPDRIAALHGIHEPQKVGIYADPRTNELQMSLGFEVDEILVMRMAYAVERAGAFAPGNFISQLPNNNSSAKRVSYFNAIYPLDPPVIRHQGKQARSGDHKNLGTSFGTWASTAASYQGQVVKKAATMLTIELPPYSQILPQNASHTAQKEKTTAAFVLALIQIFLE